MSIYLTTRSTGGDELTSGLGNNPIFPLVLPTPDVLQQIDQAVYVGEVEPFWNNLPEYGLNALCRPYGQPPVFLGMPSQFIGQWRHFPTGASRWSYGFFLAATDQYNQIIQTAYGSNGDQINPLALVMQAEGQVSAEQFYTQVFLLTARPLFRLPPTNTTLSSQIPGSSPASNSAQSIDGLYLCLFVDQRYYWQQVPVPSLQDSVPWIYNTIQAPTAAQFSDLINALKNTDCLNITLIQPDPINAAYLYPSNQFNRLEGQSAPRVLDSLLQNVGQKFVWSLGSGYTGICYAVDNAAAFDNLFTQFGQVPPRTILRGGMGNVLPL